METFLGPIARGWASEGVTVGAFEDRPHEGVVTLATLGLSRHELAMPDRRGVRLELLLAVERRLVDAEAPRLLGHLVDVLLTNHQALLRGQVLPLGHGVTPRSACTSLYVSPPSVYDDGLAQFDGSTPPTVFAWLIPVHPSEAQLVAHRGWSELEDRFVREQPNLFDPSRPALL